jgi:hypothetical protein
VGHQVLVLEKAHDFVGVCTVQPPPFDAYFHLLTPTLMQPSKYRGIRMPPNMTKIFNYWGMRDKVDEIGVVTERIVMSRRMPSPS